MPYSFTNNFFLTTSQENSIIKTYATSSQIIYDSISKDKGQFGNSINVSWNLTNSGLWRTLPNGDRLWTLVIKCNNAKSINLIYSQYWLPFGAKMFIYNKETMFKRGAYTSKNNIGTVSNPKGFATTLVPKDKIYVELYEPKNVMNQSKLSISSIIYGLLCSPIVSDKGCYGEAGPCQVNINCSEGSNWQDQKKGVAAVTVGNGKCWLSGTLLNNTSFDGTPYFLTAEHGLYGSGGNLNPGDIANWIFHWDWESKTCSNSPNYDPPFYIWSSLSS